MKDFPLRGRIEAVVLIGAVGAALLTFQHWGLGPILVAALAGGALGVRRGMSIPLSLAAASAAGAALIHFAVAPEHFQEWWGFGTFFVLCGEVQLGWALLLRRRPASLALTTGLAGSLALVALWQRSRTAGLPLGPDAGVAEAAGTADVLAVTLELVTALSCAWALRSSRRSCGSWSLRARAAGLVLTASATAWALLSVSAG